MTIPADHLHFHWSSNTPDEMKKRRWAKMVGTKEVYAQCEKDRSKRDRSNRRNDSSKSEPNSIVLEFGQLVDRGDHHHGHFVSFTIWLGLLI